MPQHPTSTPEQFIQGCPVLHVPDVVAVATYFRDVLGFRWDFGDDKYAVVWRDNSAIHLAQGESAPFGVHLFQWLRNVDAYHSEVATRGATIVSGPTDTPYEMREFAVSGPHNLRIVFGQDAE